MATEAAVVVDGRTLRHQHRRPELLAAVTEYVLDHGLSDLSLRPLASELGVTHATLIRHFVSKDKLIAEVVDRMRVDFLTTLQAEDETSGSVEFLKMSWEKLRRPREQRQFRALFEIASRAPQHRYVPVEVTARILDQWRTPLEQRLVAEGQSSVEATEIATLVLAQVRGLQLDLLITGERERIDAAFARAVEQLRRTQAGDPSQS
ncbi:TetR/AcrR family transcriptional regulator [Rhodococcus fascians]|nr:TetR/AcrR family transcriptional regulator [Rhodococcus fascians]MBY4238009.1 TetR/AcrR family transcriptional regulator [Rhodococcus fascians]MBY4253240.1 TetR/AcrR family transcriptional regulator [Rhodococcus fascians]MBY4268877.1 TetR/AcrR family transcriptional regulator [Rhodococcus fascians]